jgi:hypothetical protein
MTPQDSHTSKLLDPFEITQFGSDDEGNARDSNTAAAHTHRSQVIIPGENVEGKRHSNPASTSAINSAANCIV